MPEFSSVRGCVRSTKREHRISSRSRRVTTRRKEGEGRSRIKIDERNGVGGSLPVRGPVKIPYLGQSRDRRRPFSFAYVGTSVMAEPATREVRTTRLRIMPLDALCMLHTLAMIRKITRGRGWEERGGGGGGRSVFVHERS